jgi:hypothetical protein
LPPQFFAEQHSCFPELTLHGFFDVAVVFVVVVVVVVAVEVDVAAVEVEAVAAGLAAGAVEA